MIGTFLADLGRQLCNRCIAKSTIHQHKQLSIWTALSLQAKRYGHNNYLKQSAGITNTPSTRGINTLDSNTYQLPDYADTSSTVYPKTLLNDMIVIDEFVSELEENSILKEIEPYMARVRYEYSHWDDAILGYRETERSTWNSENAKVITRLKETAFANVSPPTEFVHVLDLEESGQIKPHKDSIRYCGDTIAGISLLSDSVMRLVAVDNKDSSIDFLLKRHSLYIMRNSARYDYTHQILANDLSYFKQKHIQKGRRISIICRNSPVTGDPRHEDS